jgi:septum formation protein
MAANIPEEVLPGESPAEHVCRLAASKAKAINASASEIVLGADTVVVLDGHILGKPVDEADALRMLQLLSGRRHEVVTGVCLRHSRGIISHAERTGVGFATLSDREIKSYIATGEPMDKAGAYAIQGLASKFIERVEGCYFNVVGLPIAFVYRSLQQISSD